MHLVCVWCPHGVLITIAGTAVYWFTLVAQKHVYNSLTLLPFGAKIVDASYTNRISPHTHITLEYIHVHTYIHTCISLGSKVRPL